MPIKILLFDLVVIYPVGTVHEFNYCLALKWEMFWSHLCTKCSSFRNLSLGNVWLHYIQSAYLSFFCIKK